MPKPFSTRPYRAVLLWQAAATLIIAVIAGSWVGVHGALSALLGGGLLGIYNDLSGLGLSMDGMRAAGTAFMDYAKEKAGPDPVEALVKSIPGLSALA